MNKISGFQNFVKLRFHITFANSFLFANEFKINSKKGNGINQVINFIIFPRNPDRLGDDLTMNIQDS